MTREKTIRNSFRSIPDCFRNSLKTISVIVIERPQQHKEWKTVIKMNGRTSKQLNAFFFFSERLKMTSSATQQGNDNKLFSQNIKNKIIFFFFFLLRRYFFSFFETICGGFVLECFVKIRKWDSSKEKGQEKKRIWQNTSSMLPVSKYKGYRMHFWSSWHDFNNTWSMHCAVKQATVRSSLTLPSQSEASRRDSQRSTLELTSLHASISFVSESIVVVGFSRGLCTRFHCG